MANIDPLVSIVIPVFNGANYLQGAIESALAQSYRNCEVIVVNDGSTDEGRTESIATSYDDRITYISKPNGGVSSALNLGIANMKGQYFSWLSHDDMYSADKVERQIRFIESHPEVRLVGSGLHIIDEHGERVGNYLPKTVVVVRNGRDVMDQWVYGCSLLIEQDVFDEVGVFNEENRTTQDLELWLKIVYAGHPIYLLPELLCEWRRHPGMGSFQIRQTYIREVEALFRALLKNYPLAFFAAEPSAQLTRRDRARILDWLGEQSWHRGGQAAAGTFLRAALLTNPNPLDPELWARMRKVASRFKQTMSKSGDARYVSFDRL